MLAVAASSQWTMRYVVLCPDSRTPTSIEASTEPNPEDVALTQQIFSNCHPLIADIFYTDLGFRCLTPIQCVTIPSLLRTTKIVTDPFSPLSSDVMIAAPTGQGKTLCYLIPIFSTLFYRIAPTVAALIFAPTRELVNQIATVCIAFCGAPSLTLSKPSRPLDSRCSDPPSRLISQGSSSCPSSHSHHHDPQHSFPSALSRRTACDPTLPHLRVICLTGNAPFVTERCELYGEGSSNQRLSDGGVSQLILPDGGPSDIVVTSPGRFVEHCQRNTMSVALALHERSTRATTLTENPTIATCSSIRHVDGIASPFLPVSGCVDALVLPAALWRHVRWIVFDEADRLLEQSYQGWVDELNRMIRHCDVVPTKIVASATMTNNPEKLNRLCLNRPLVFSTSAEEGAFSVPAELTQYWSVSPEWKHFNMSSTMTKPLILLYLIHQLYAGTKKQCLSHNSTDNNSHSYEKDCSRAKKRRTERAGPDASPSGRRKEEQLKGELMHRGENKNHRLGEEEQRARSPPPGDDGGEDRDHSGQSLKTVIFCGSRETAQRLSILLNLHFGKDAFELSPLPQLPPSTVLPLRLRTSDATTDGHEDDDSVPGVPLLLTVCHLTSTLSTQERRRILRVFEDRPGASRDRRIDILVCSDILARGLDISALDVVINYDCPDSLRSYVHRVGRTARAGRPGTTFTLVSQDEVPMLTRMLKSNRLPSRGHDTPTPMTLWDIVHHHRIPKLALKRWVQPETEEEQQLQNRTKKRARVARKEQQREDGRLHLPRAIDDGLAGQPSSYYSKLLMYLDHRLESAAE